MHWVSGCVSVLSLPRGVSVGRRGRCAWDDVVGPGDGILISSWTIARRGHANVNASRFTMLTVGSESKTQARELGATHPVRQSRHPIRQSRLHQSPLRDADIQIHGS
jgi:hypothetical protein